MYVDPVGKEQSCPWEPSSHSQLPLWVKMNWIENVFVPWTCAIYIEVANALRWNDNGFLSFQICPLNLHVFPELCLLPQILFCRSRHRGRVTTPAHMASKCRGLARAVLVTSHSLLRNLGVAPPALWTHCWASMGFSFPAWEEQDCNLKVLTLSNSPYITRPHGCRPAPGTWNSLK